MKKIGSKVLLMMVLFVVIFGLNTITSVRSQNRVKRSGLEITEQYIPIQTEIFTIQKSMERGQKYLNIISLYDNAELRQQLEGSLAEEVSTITESEKMIDVYLKDNNNTKLKDAIKKYEEFLDKVLLQFSTIQEYVDTGDFAQASIALGSDFQNLVRDMGEKTETNLTENLEGGISEQSKLYNQAVDMNIQVCNLLEYLTQRDIQTKNSGVNVRYRGKHRFFKGFNEFIKEKTRRCDNDFEKIERHVFF